MAEQAKIVEMDVAALDSTVVHTLRALLRGEFSEWRINVGVYSGLSTGTPSIVGAFTVTRETLFAQADVLPYIDRPNKTSSIQRTWSQR